MSSFFIIISSLPIQLTLQIINTGYLIDEEDENHLPNSIVLILTIKLLRYLNIQRFLNKMENLIKYVNFSKLILFRIARTFFWMLIATHFFACLFVFVNYDINKGYFLKPPYDVDNDYMKYTCGL